MALNHRPARTAPESVSTGRRRRLIGGAGHARPHLRFGDAVDALCRSRRAGRGAAGALAGDPRRRARRRLDPGVVCVGAGDLDSDCDWIVATHAPLTEEQVAALRGIHDEIPTREGHWPHDIEGSYAPLDELRRSAARPTVAVQDPGNGRWSGATIATAAIPAGSCASTASLSPGRSRGPSCLRCRRSCCAVRRRLRSRR